MNQTYDSGVVLYNLTSGIFNIMHSKLLLIQKFQLFITPLQTTNNKLS